MKKVILGFIAGVAVFGASFVGATLVLDNTNDQPETVEVSQSTQETSQSDTTTLTNDSDVSVNETQDSIEQKGGPDISKGFMYQLGNSTVTLNDAINMVPDNNRLGKMTGSEPEGTAQTWIPVLVDGQEAWCSIAHSDGSVTVFNNNGTLATGHSN